MPPSRNDGKCPGCGIAFSGTFCTGCGMNVNEFFEKPVLTCTVCGLQISEEDIYCGVCGVKREG
jgi:predicted amidophosphoribosyltransferase